MDFQIVKDLITHQLTDATVEVHDMTGTRDHLEILIISDAFEGKILIDQHQIIMDILSEKIGTNEIHAVKLKTLTKAKAQKKGLL